VAIKSLHAGYHPAEAEALIRETTTLSGLEGLGFPRVLHLGRGSDGRLFLVREMAEGESLDRVQEKEPRRALSLLCAAATILTVVHRAGLLHGDIKPANLIVRPDGTVALIDLGLATAFREGGQSSVGLTPHYAAPEVRAGGPLTVQAEVYSLGVVLRDALSDGADTELSEGASEALTQIARRATNEEPSSRFPSVDEFAEALRGALGGDVPIVDPTGPPWPVKGVDAIAYQLGKALDALDPGQTLLVGGEPGCGISTLLRKAAWAAALGEEHAAYVDDKVVEGDLAADEIRGCARPRALLFFDSLSEVYDKEIAEILQAGARVVRLARTGEVAHLRIPPLDFGVVSDLLQGALPGMPKGLVKRVVQKLGANPGPLRQFALAAEGAPISTEADVDRILSGTVPETGTPEEIAEKYLDRGHYKEAARYFDECNQKDPRVKWLRARLELAAGSPQEALRLCEEARALRPKKDLEERILATRARAKLGLGDYTGALTDLEALDKWKPAAKAEGLAYRGLSLSLLGKQSEALLNLEAGLVAARDAGSLLLQSLVGSSLATALWRAGRHEEAARAYEVAIDAAREAGDSGMLASAQINLAGLMKHTGDLAASIKLLECAVDAARRAGRTTSLQQALLNLTNSDLYLGRLERARGQLERLGDPARMPPALRAQSHGLRAEHLARVGDLEAALPEFERCEKAWEELGRKPDAAEAALEAVLAAAGPSSDRAEMRYVPSLELLRELLARGKRHLEGKETPLVLLAEARVAYASGEEEEAERLAHKARALAQESNYREWAWRAAALEAVLFEAAGKRTRAQRANQDAVEILEDIGARLPQDLREVYWSEERRRALRGSLEVHQAASVVPRRPHEPPLRGGANEYITGTGTDAISRLTATPLERRLARVLAINSDLAGEVNLERLATKIVAHACEFLSAERGYLLLGSSAESLEVIASRGAQGEDHKEFSRSIAGEVLTHGKPLVSVDAGRDTRLQAFESVHLSLVSAVACVPVLSPQGTPIGALYVETRTGARPGFGDEVPTLQAFADQAAIALENARLLSELRQKTAELEERNTHLKEARARLKELLGKRTARLREVKKELDTTRSQLASHASYGGMVGGSDSMRKIYSLIERVKDTDVPVLITGESGTGKEVAARAIHQGSSRGHAKMLAVNCGAIPESILESELFGHTRGAFTGADRDRKGLFREADGGVLFLDEIGETPLKMQASLLRVLQEGMVRPVGGAHEIPVNVRVIFATNRDLTSAVEAGTFREDLFYRIQVVQIAHPPLRERREDIPLLVDHFLQRFALRFGQEKKTLSRDALGLIMEHPMPGNIRQLENALLNAWVMAEDEVIEAEDIELPEAPRISREPREVQKAREGRDTRGSRDTDSRHAAAAAHDASPQRPSLQRPPSSHGSSHRTTENRRTTHQVTKKRGTLSEHQRSERRRIVEALEATGWNRLKAATLLKMPRRTFYRRLREYNIQ
jgi:serine/threonine-protein kinase PknK